MKNLKLSKSLFISLSLVLLMTFFSFAGESKHNNEKTNARYKLIPIVEEYSPETLEEWKQVIEERKELKKHFKKLSKSKVIDSERHLVRRNKLVNELKAKVEKGEITQEEARKRLEEVKIKCKGKKNHKEKAKEIIILKKDLAKAISNEDKAQIKAILNELYVKYQESNQRLKAKTIK